MKNIVTIIIFVIAGFNIKSQTIQIQGRLIDSLTKVPLPYSNIIIGGRDKIGKHI